jgi:hypothetical protein
MELANPVRQEIIHCEVLVKDYCEVSAEPSKTSLEAVKVPRRSEWTLGNTHVA